MKANRRRSVRYDRLAAAGVIFIVLIILLVTCIKGCSKDTDTGKSSLLTNPSGASSTDSAGSADPSGGTPSGDSATDSGAMNTAGYTTIAAKQADLCKGDLVLVNADHAYTFPADTSNLVSIYDNKLSTYKAKDCITLLDKNVIEQFNKLMTGYYETTKNIDIQVINGYRTKESQDSIFKSGSTTIQGGYSDYHTGLSLDLGIFPQGKSSGYYTATGTYAWIAEHMAGYGFITRYPEDKKDSTGQKGKSYQFRYVGAPHASYMAENKLCLEEYLEQLKGYAFGGKTLKTAVGAQNYEIYYIPASADGDTTLYVPTGGTYTVSGNNMDGFIVTVTL